MKSEFLWRRVLFTKAKKNYASVAMLQEGKVLGDKLDIKGLAMKKSSVNKNISAYLQKLLEMDVLKAKDINVPDILNKLAQLEESIKDKFLNGSIEYLTPTSCKKLSAYKNPYTIASVRAAIAWNAVYPEKPIVLPENFNMVKCTMSKLTDIEELQESHPEVYEKLLTIFEDSNMQNYGITYFAVPKSETELPDWLIPYIDVETIIADNLNVFNPIVESLGLQILASTEGNFYSNILTV